MRKVHMTRRQALRRRIATRMDRWEIYLPEWAEQALCLIVGGGHTPIWTGPRGPQCAWCDAPVPKDSPDTMPRDYKIGTTL